MGRSPAVEPGHSSCVYFNVAAGVRTPGNAFIHLFVQCFGSAPWIAEKPVILDWNGLFANSAECRKFYYQGGALTN
jgi:hypothetical protein